MRILVAEDDHRIAEPLLSILGEEGHQVDHAAEGESALEQGMLNDYDAILLDVMMPKLDGFEVARILRENEVDTPIVFVTARGEVDDRVQGLDTGGDAYLVKPFDVPELLAVLRAVVRRRGEQISSVVRFADDRIAYDGANRSVLVDGEREVLTARELDVLETLLHVQGRWCTREDILDRAWGPSFEGQARIVDVYVRYLRRKLGDEVIESERGRGYRIP